MKALILTIAILLSLSSKNANAQIVTSVAGSTCTNCTENPNTANQQIRNVRNAITSQMSVGDLSQINSSMNFANACSGFVNSKGLGSWGSVVVNEMRAKNYQALYDGTSDIRAVCPAYNSLNSNSKELVWVMIINAMAHLESSCNAGITATGPNGQLIGLLQLHNGREQAYAPNCRKGDGKTGAGNIRCGLSMLDGQLRRDGMLFSRKSYWDVLRPQARSQKYLKVRQAVSRLGICK